MIQFPIYNQSPNNPFPIKQQIKTIQKLKQQLKTLDLKIHFTLQYQNQNQPIHDSNSQPNPYIFLPISHYKSKTPTYFIPIYIRPTYINKTNNNLTIIQIYQLLHLQYSQH